jgi:hypothetical protein
MHYRSQLDPIQTSLNPTQELECHRRFFLSRIIFISLFLPNEKKKAGLHFSNLKSISRFRKISITETIGEIADLQNCPEDEFLNQHYNKIILLAQYLIYGNQQLELSSTTEEQRNIAQKRAYDVIRKYNEKNLSINLD